MSGSVLLKGTDGSGLRGLYAPRGFQNLVFVGESDENYLFSTVLASVKIPCKNQLNPTSFKTPRKAHEIYKGIF